MLAHPQGQSILELPGSLCTTAVLEYWYPPGCTCWLVHQQTFRPGSCRCHCVVALLCASTWCCRIGQWRTYALVTHPAITSPDQLEEAKAKLECTGLLCHPPHTPPLAKKTRDMPPTVRRLQCEAKPVKWFLPSDYIIIVPTTLYATTSYVASSPLTNRWMAHLELVTIPNLLRVRSLNSWPMTPLTCPMPLMRCRQYSIYQTNSRCGLAEHCCWYVFH